MSNPPANERYSDIRHKRPGVRYDQTGRMIPARSSGIHCEQCGIPFALGFLPVDGGRVCRDCRRDRVTAVSNPPANERYSDIRHKRPGVRYDQTGRMIPARSSGIRCEQCGIPFALGFLPVDGGRVCRDCRRDRFAGRADQLRADDPALFGDDDTPIDPE